MAEDNIDAGADARDGTIELVSAYVSNSNTRISGEELQTLIRDTFATLASLTVSAPITSEPVSTKSAKSKGEIRKSITPDGLVSFIDGKSYKTLRRHLTTKGHTPESYRETFGLPADYPLVAASYSAARSQMAKDIGLGAKGRQKATPKPKKARAAKTAPD